ncbi:MAG: alpha/beta hydrolase [Thermomicrobium sp.]|nr:alpha/beta hydrolase [Thermomicrobium sp.]
MSALTRLDPELAAVLAAFPEELLLDLRDIPFARQRMAILREALASHMPPLPADVAVTDEFAPNRVDRTVVRVRLYRPIDVPSPLPVLLWIHGGGYVMGTPEMNDPQCAEFARALPALVASVDYRLAPEFPYPAPLEDCYAALCWVWERATELGADPGRIAIAGASAGGGLAAGLALLARDRGEIPVRFQLLIYPMLDDRNQTPSSYEITDRRLIWTREWNLLGWRAYLGREPGSPDVPAYAAPARAADLRGLPQAYILVGTADLFRDEDIVYAQRLMQAGVLTELHVFAGAFHGFDAFAPTAWVSQRANAEVLTVLRRALTG